MLKLKLQYFAHLIWRADSFEKTLMLGKIASFLLAGRKGDDKVWDGGIASLTQWMWDWVNSRSWWWTGRPGILQSMGLQRVGHDWLEACLKVGLIIQQCYQEGIFYLVFTVSLPLWRLDGCNHSRKQGEGDKRVNSSFSLYQGKKSFLQALNQLLLTLQWSSRGHMPTPRPFTGKGEWVHHDWMKPVITYPVCWALSLNKIEACWQARRGMAFGQVPQGVCIGLKGIESQLTYPNLLHYLLSN